ncbi:competence/damage-inducible protein A [Peptococcus simiae]|uniref:Putative competence-damage inducible protein n=1 Tax=Peptococcus simiae TaxID=1643805 RepID=A0ABW9GZM4_9FIRM
MQAEIIAVGSELTSGHVLNTNSAWLAQQVEDYGLKVVSHVTVGDAADQLERSLRLALDRADWVIVTGGLGPTYDDITKEVAAKVWGQPLLLSDEAMAHIDNFFKDRSQKATANNKKQAMVPKGAEILANPSGLAPGIWLKNEEATLVLLPGPPHEMKATFEASLAPRLAATAQSAIRRHALHFYGIGEAEVDSRLDDILPDNSNPLVAPYAKGGEVELQVTAYGPSDQAAEDLIKPVIQTLIDHFKDYFYGIDVDHLKYPVSQQLARGKWSMASAESCTGGLISKWFTDIPGSSAYFAGGICTYTEKAKQYFLQVQADTLAKYGAVSAQTAAEMADGARAAFQTDLAISTTGIAGPGGGSPEKPVGLAYIGLATPTGTFTWHFQANALQTKHRSAVRDAVGRAALFHLFEYLKQNPEALS